MKPLIVLTLQYVVEYSVTDNSPYTIYYIEFLPLETCLSIRMLIENYQSDTTLED